MRLRPEEQPVAGDRGSGNEAGIEAVVGQHAKLTLRRNLGHIGCRRLQAVLAGPLIQSNFLNCSIVRPASRTIPPIVYSFTGSLRGTVMIRVPSVITMCLP